MEFALESKAICAQIQYEIVEKHLIVTKQPVEIRFIRSVVALLLTHPRKNTNK
jgi:hypothetical protein